LTLGLEDKIFFVVFSFQRTFLTPETNNNKPVSVCQTLFQNNIFTKATTKYIISELNLIVNFCETKAVKQKR